jgi:hypothetical protein
MDFNDFIYSKLILCDRSNQYWPLPGSEPDHDVLPVEHDQFWPDFPPNTQSIQLNINQNPAEHGLELNPHLNLRLPDVEASSDFNLDQTFEEDWFTDFCTSDTVEVSRNNSLTGTTDSQSPPETQSVAVAHMKIQSCPDCQKTFRRRCDLTKHRREHTRPIACLQADCPKRFPYQRDCDRHVKADHKALVTEKDYTSCWKCGNAFTRKDSLKRHLWRVHKTHVSFRSKTSSSPSASAAVLDRLHPPEPGNSAVLLTRG